MCLEGTSHPDRDLQFNHINKKCKEFQEENQSVISVDTKRKSWLEISKTEVKNYAQKVANNHEKNKIESNMGKIK